MESIKNHHGLPLIAIALLLCFCSNPVINTSNKGVSKTVTVAGTLKKSQGQSKIIAGLTDADSIYACQVCNGQVALPGSKMSRAANINSDGTFSVQLDKTERDSSGKESAVEWVLILFNSKAATRFDKIVGFLALKEIDQTLIKFPLSKAKTDTLKMGTITQKGNESVADTTIHNDTAMFALTLTQLEEMAHTGRTLKIIKNIYAATTDVSQKGMAITPTYTLGMQPLSVALNKELLPQNYFDTGTYGFGIRIDSYGSPLFNNDQLQSKAATIDLYPPAGSTMHIEQTLSNGQIVVWPVTSFISTDTSKNPHVVCDSNGNQMVVNVLVLPGPSGTNDVSILFPLFKAMPPNGVWNLKENQSTLITQFDLGLGNPIDTATGKPLIYVPSLEVDVDQKDTTVHRVIVKWYYWDSQAGNFAQAGDADLFQRNVTFVNIRVFDSFPLDGTGDQSDEYSAGPTTPVPLTVTFTPSKKIHYKDPTVFDEKLGVSVSYTADGQNFSMSVMGHKTTQE